MKKHRGLKKYYKRLEYENEFNKITLPDLDNPCRYDKYWHIHFDPGGCGDNSFKRRKPHLDKLFRHFNLLANSEKKLKANFRLYAVILDYSSHSDALFMHAVDPDNRHFPFKIEDLSYQSTFTNTALHQYINDLQGYEKLYGVTQEAFCLLWSAKAGQPFR